MDGDAVRLRLLQEQKVVDEAREPRGVSLHDLEQLRALLPEDGDVVLEELGIPGDRRERRP